MVNNPSFTGRYKPKYEYVIREGDPDGESMIKIARRQLADFERAYDAAASSTCPRDAEQVVEQADLMRDHLAGIVDWITYAESNRVDAGD